MRKFYTYSFAISLGFFLILYACEKDEVRTEDFKQDFIEAAAVHTEAMEVCLKAIKSTDTSDETGLLLLVEEVAVKHLAQSSLPDLCHALGNNKLSKEIERLFLFRKMVSDPNYKGEYTYNDFLFFTIQEHIDDLSEDQYDLLQSVNNIMESYSTAEEIVPLLTHIQNVDCLSLPEEERYVIYAATTIGIESANYWANNMDDWINAVANGDSCKQAEMHKWFNWGSIVASDIGGAIGGAIAGAITGSIAGGVGAGPGAIAGALGGAVGVSATDAVIQIVNHIID